MDIFVTTFSFFHHKQRRILQKNSGTCGLPLYFCCMRYFRLCLEQTSSSPLFSLFSYNGSSPRKRDNAGLRHVHIKGQHNDMHVLVFLCCLCVFTRHTGHALASPRLMYMWFLTIESLMMYDITSSTAYCTSKKVILHNY